jgi:pyruvate formate lyase activating enzyme
VHAQLGSCHNRKTSQARYVTDKDVYYYTPEQVVETALGHEIRVLSWTHNDPVIWHEFILDTAKLAKEAGLINLCKSAFFIAKEAVDELLPVIDIFSISIKSIDPEYYRKVTTGWVEPVLAATKKVYQAGIAASTLSGCGGSSPARQGGLASATGYTTRRYARR